MQYPPETPQGSAPLIADPSVAQKKKNTLLIVVAITSCGCLFLFVIIAAAIMIPVFAQARAKARATTCMSNEKLMALGMLMYLQDYDESFPPASEWMTKIDPYIKNDTVYHCPSVPEFVTGRTGPPYGYAFNSTLSKKSLADIASPETTVMLFDSSTMDANANDALQSICVPGRHSDTDIFALVDGHARAMRPDQLSTLTSGSSPGSSSTGSGSQP